MRSRECCAGASTLRSTLPTSWAIATEGAASKHATASAAFRVFMASLLIFLRTLFAFCCCQAEPRLSPGHGPAKRHFQRSVAILTHYKAGNKCNPTACGFLRCRLLNVPNANDEPEKSQIPGEIPPEGPLTH